MEPALPRSPVPLGSGSPANAALRGARGLPGGAGVSLILPPPGWGGAGRGHSPCPMRGGSGENL